MSQKAPNQLVIEVDPRLQKTIKLHSEVRGISPEEVAHEFIVIRTINDTIQKVVQVEIRKGLRPIRDDLNARRKSDDERSQVLYERIDKLEILIIQVLDLLS